MQDLLADSNPMVVANAVAALADVRETSTRNIFTLNTQSLQKLLRALNECTEWGQVQISALLTASSKSSSESNNADASGALLCMTVLTPARLLCSPTDTCSSAG